MPSRERFPLALATSLFLASAAFALPYVVDDAYVVARLARNLVGGSGLVMNVGGPRSDAVTEPMWLLPMVLGEAVARDGVFVAKALGIASSLAAIVVAMRALVSRVPPFAAIAAALFLGASAPLAIAAVSGLGTSLAALLATLLLVATIDGRSARFVGSLAFVAWFTRPELVPTVALLVLLHGRDDPRALRVSAPLFALGGVAVITYRVLLFDHAAPLAVLAKPLELAHGASYVARAAFGTGVATIVALSLVAAGRLSREVRVALVVVVSHLAWVMLAGGDWMPAYRLLVPILPCAAMLLAFALRDASERSTSRRRLAHALAVVTLLFVVVDAGVNLPRARASAAARTGVGVELARYLRDHTHRVALVDAGFLAYASGVEVLDLAGLTDEAIARRPGGHLDKRIEAADVALRDPDAIILHAAYEPRVDADGSLLSLAGYPVERRVAAFPFVRAEYRVARVARYAESYFYVVLMRGR